MFFPALWICIKPVDTSVVPHIDRIECVQKKFIKYALRGLGWTDMFDLPPYVDRCALIRLETLAERRVNACVMFIFDILSGRVNSSNFFVA
jgi:hypothetical protein